MAKGKPSGRPSAATDRAKAGLKASPSTEPGGQEQNTGPVITVGGSEKMAGRSCWCPTARRGAARWRNRSQLAQTRGVPIFVVGVGTTAGGVIPDPQAGPERPLLSSPLDRQSLGVIATAGGGRYFELGREDDRDIANAIIDSTRRRASTGGVNETFQELYWWALLLAAAFVGLGVLFLRDQAALALQLAAAAGVLVLLITSAK